MRDLTAAQREILGYLARRNTDRDGCPSGPEVSEMLGHRSKAWASDKLKSLARYGLVERMGQTFTGAWCFRITDAGRASLSSGARHGG